MPVFREHWFRLIQPLVSQTIKSGDGISHKMGTTELNLNIFTSIRGFPLTGFNCKCNCTTVFTHLKNWVSQDCTSYTQGCSWLFYKSRVYFVFCILYIGVSKRGEIFISKISKQILISVQTKMEVVVLICYLNVVNWWFNHDHVFGNLVLCAIQIRLITFLQ